jgi:hypothetical protein
MQNLVDTMLDLKNTKKKKKSESTIENFHKFDM